MRTTLAVLLLLAFVACTSQTAERASVIVIDTDDQPPHTLRHMPIVQKELVQKGVSFANAFVTTPLCCPSRASILTGQYAHHHGVLTNSRPNGGVWRFDDSATLGTWLRAQGYRTALIGKYMNGYGALSPYIPPGWDAWHVFVRGQTTERGAYFDYSLNENGTVVEYGVEASDYSTDVLAQRAVDFILASDDRPFFLFFNPFAPHNPFIPAPRHVDTLSHVEGLRTPNINEADVSDKPPWIQELDLFTDTELATLAQREQKALESLLAVDDAVGQLLEALRRLGREQNTVIIFMSDNGIAVGQHRLKGKGSPYEESIRVPLVVRQGGGLPSGRTDDHLVLNIDIAPTVLEIAGADIPSSVDGASLLPLLENPRADWRDHFLFENWPTRGGRPRGSAVPPYAGIRTASWKYIRYATGELELYDLREDPYELANLAEEAASEAVIRKLHSQLEILRPD